MRRHVTFVELPLPKGRDINYELQWLGTSLGLFGERDKDKSCFRVFLELVKSGKLGVPLSSDDIARNLNLTRGTAVHHLNHLIASGIVINEGRRYWLRQADLQLLIGELKR